MKRIPELKAPLQSEILLTDISRKQFTADKDNDDHYFNSMVAAYQEAGSPFLKRQILSLFVNHYSKETLTAIPGLTKHNIDSARKYAMVNRTDQLDSTSSFSSKLPTDKVQHFISFISQPQFIQDVAFGERILKLSSGQKVHIPDVVRTVIRSRIISSYLAYCAEVNFHALKRSSLYHILKQCAASQRKSLFGLDNTTADGMTAFDKLVQLSENMVAYSPNTRENVFKILEHPMVTKRGLDNTCQRKRKFKETLPNQEEASIHVVNEVMDIEDEVTDMVDEYTCGECGVAFTSLKDYNIHQDIGYHNMTSSDHVKILWTRKCVGIKEKVTKHPSSSEIEDACAQRSLVKGCALKGKRVSKRFNKKVKDFVAQLFEEGERTGRKYTPTEASKTLRTARDEDGNRTFSPEEWLSSQQVQGLFCRFDKKSNFVFEPKEETDENLNDIIYEIACQENEDKLIQSICM